MTVAASVRSKNRIEVFVSYSRETDDHREWVGKLADRLDSESDVHVVLDEYDLYGGKDLPHFMERCARCDRVVVIVTSRFAEKADQREGGVGYETGIAAAELATSQTTDKFIPVLREGSGIPVFLRGKRYVDLRPDQNFEQGVDELLRAIRRQADRSRPAKRVTNDEPKVDPAAPAGARERVVERVTEGSIITSISQTGGQVAHEITNFQPVFAVPEKRPLVQVAFSWREGEPKGKPFIVTNHGDDEARHIKIQPIALDHDRSFSFESVGQLMPHGSPVEREPKPDHEVGMVFRTLIDGIEMTVRDRMRERKSSISTAGEWVDQLDQHVRAEQSAIDEFENIPVTVTYQDRKGKHATLRYRLEITMFGSLTKAELHFISED
jgi:hypothetical protein